MLSQKPEQIPFKFFSFIFNLTLKVKANRPTIQQGSKVFYTPGPNLVILAWTSEQAWGSHTHEHTYTMAIPEGQKLALWVMIKWWSEIIGKKRI